MFDYIIDIKSAGYKRIMLPVVMLITTYSMKILPQISSMNKIPILLFREIALLSMILIYSHPDKERIMCQRQR
ncbi:MAG: hypothetical protein NTV16_00515 [Actinobacteria bacterium]|nr:hypothetical protein [Actinomycetota bacterium]